VSLAGVDSGEYGIRLSKKNMDKPFVLAIIMSLLSVAGFVLPGLLM